MAVNVPIRQFRMPQMRQGGPIAKYQKQPSDLVSLFNLFAHYKQGQQQQQQTALEQALMRAQTQRALRPPQPPRQAGGKLITKKDPKTDKWHTYLIDPATGAVIQDLGPAPPKQFWPPGMPWWAGEEELPEGQTAPKEEIVPPTEQGLSENLWERIKALRKPAEPKPPTREELVKRGSIWQEGAIPPVSPVGLEPIWDKMTDEEKQTAISALFRGVPIKTVMEIFLKNAR